MPRGRYKLILQDGLETKTSIPKSTLHRYRYLNQKKTNLDSHNSLDTPEVQVLDQASSNPDCSQNDFQEATAGRYKRSSRSSSSDCSDEDENFVRTQQKPQFKKHLLDNKELKSQMLHENAKITGIQSTTMIFAFALRHGLSDTAVQDLISLINFHLPTSVTIPGSLYLQEKKLNPNYSSIQKHYYCLNCQTAVGKNESVCGRESCTNSECGEVNTKEIFFITMDVRETLNSILSTDEVQNSLLLNFEKRKHWDGVYTNIIDGDAYRKFGIVGEDISCCVNTDGVNLFKSSQFSIWPILLSINELCLKVRRKHTFLAGLWFSGDKPNFDTFLNAFVTQNISLRIQGVDWSHKSVKKTSKVFFPLFAADSPAKCQALCMKQFNGLYGCPTCLAAGESIDGNGPWVYPPSQCGTKRTHQTFIQHLVELQEKLQNGVKVDFHWGLKGASPLLRLPELNIVDGAVFDYMHAVPGILKMFSLAWLDSSNHERPYYVGTRRKEINTKINSWKFPNESSRTLRELCDLSYWKASEWKIWMIIMIPTLSGILPDAYLKHFSKFTLGISLLLGDKVTTSDLEESSKLLHEFVHLVPGLYDESFCTFNLHILTHAPDCVKNWGPLWGYSLFIFENYNGVLSDSFFGTSKVGQQIAKWMVRAQRVRALGVDFAENEEVNAFYTALINNKKYFAKSQKCGQCTFLGKGKPYSFSSAEKKELLKIQVAVNDGICFEKCLLNGQTFSTVKKNTEARANCVVEANGSIYLITALIFAKGFPEGLFFVRKLSVVEGIWKCGFRVLNIGATVKIIQSFNIINKKYYIRYNSTSKQVDYIIPMLNSSESE